MVRLLKSFILIIMNRPSILLQTVCSLSLIFSGTVHAAAIQTWTVYGQGYTVDPTGGQNGANALKCTNTDSTQTSGAFSTIQLNQTKPEPIMITGWSDSVNVNGVSDNDYSIYVDLTYTNGSSLWGQTAPFNTGTHTWQQEKLIIVPTQPVRSMNVYALFRNHSGTVLFDDFRVGALDTANLFDGQAIQAPSLPSTAASGWFVRDVAKNSNPEMIANGHDALGLRLDAKSSVQNIQRGSLRNLGGGTRCVTLYFVTRFTAANAVWWNDIRSSAAVSPGREYANLVHVNAGVTGQLSLYPFGCVTSRTRGLALGIPPDLGPRISRISYNAHSGLLYAAFDLALLPRGDSAGHDSAPVAIINYPVDPAWGFRDAARIFYATFPWAYARRTHAEGIWMPFTAPSKVSNNKDFHFAYHEGDNDVFGDRHSGIASFRYVEPMTYWMAIPKGAPRNYDAALAQIQSQAKSSDPVVSHQAQAVLTSGSQDENGRYNVAFRDTPWCDGAVWVLNPNPGMHHDPLMWTKARLNADGEPVPGAANQPDGEYLDSLEAWADVVDYRPESLNVLKEPLTFTPASFVPTTPTWFSVYDDAAALSKDLHAHGKLLMANSVPWRFTAFAPTLDVMGTETSMFSETGDFEPESDAIMNLRRTASYHKPYLLLLNTDFSKIDYKKTEQYFQRCLFYGIYPSMFSANAADHPYWENPALYNRDRPLFRKYIPLVQTLSAAGWEPVTWARANQDNVWVERFGTKYLTVLNSAAQPMDATLQIDMSHFTQGASKSARCTVLDAINGRTLGTYSAQGLVSLKLHLEGSEVQVLSLNLSQQRTKL